MTRSWRLWTIRKVTEEESSERLKVEEPAREMAPFPETLLEEAHHHHHRHQDRRQRIGYRLVGNEEVRYIDTYEIQAVIRALVVIGAVEMIMLMLR